MGRIVFLAAALVLAWVAVAQGRDGIYVAGEPQSNQNGSPQNIWSSPGTINSYTGKEATGDLYRYLERYRNRDSWNSKGHNYNPYTVYRW